MAGDAGYDEFGMLADNAAEVGLPFGRPPKIARRSFAVAPGQDLSAILWRSALPELVLLHGSGQNAHAWDTVALALGRPLIAIDLPGHGHSGPRSDRNHGPWRNAETVAAVLDQLHSRWPGRGLAVVGMSLGGATAIRLAATRPDLVRRLVVVDVTPQVKEPARPPSQADRGAVALAADFTPLWEDVAAISVPVMLVRGSESTFVPDCDAETFLRLQPQARVEMIPGSGHEVQSDQPMALARLIEHFAFA